MIFSICRAGDSYGRSGEPPCEGAYFHEHRDIGCRHVNLWRIELPTLEALIDLSKRVKETLIVDPVFYDPPDITIYDSYVE